MPSLLRQLLLVPVLVAALARPAAAQEADVVLETVLGDIPIDLFEGETPGTVENFLTYLRDGEYAQSLIHRSVPGFVIQGGGYRVIDGQISPLTTGDPIANEPGISNSYGTLAMAKRAGDPDSATSQWFINLGDNTDLDSQNGGFTVFGRVVGEGMVVAEAIAALPVYNLNVAGFSEVPLRDFTPGEEDLTLDNFVLLDAVESPRIQINAGLNDAWFEPATSGQGMFFTVFPEAGLFSLAWFTYDTVRPAADAGATVGEAGHRWVTALGPFSGGTATLEATLTRGGLFDAALPAPNRVDAYGTLTVTFEGCDNALVSYEFPGAGLDGEVPVQRVAKDNVALCEALSDAAAAD